MGFSFSGYQPTNYVTRIVEYQGERWRVTNVTKDTVHLDYVNVPGEPREDKILTLPRKGFTRYLVPRTKG